MKEFFNWFLALDRRYIYILVAIGVALPFFFPMGLPNEATEPVLQAFDAVDAISPDGPPLLLSIDYDPAVVAELDPMSIAVLRHCFKKNIRVMITVLYHTGAGVGIAQSLVEKAAAEYGKVRDKDYALLGFLPGGYMIMLQMCDDIHRTYSKDFYGTPIEDIPMMQDVRTLRDVPLVMCVAASAIYEQWCIFAQAKCGVPIVAGVTAVSATDAYPFLQSGQLLGLIGGLKGAAEYEALLNKKLGLELADASRGMDSQSITHVLIIILIVIGNIAYFMLRRGKE